MSKSEQAERDARLLKLKESVLSNFKRMTPQEIEHEALDLHIWRFQAKEYIEELEGQLKEVGGVL